MSWLGSEFLWFLKTKYLLPKNEADIPKTAAIKFAIPTDSSSRIFIFSVSIL